MPSIGSFILHSMALAPALPVLAGSCANQFNWNDTENVIAFGDSYTYAQGTLGYANSTFIGSYLNLSYTPAQLLSTRIVQNDTFSTANRGPNWIEQLTGCGVNPGETDPQTCAVQLWDFAFGGADVSVAYTPLHHPWSVQLVNQTATYLEYGEPVLRGTVGVRPARTLVAFWIGINDIGDSKAYNVSFPDFYEQIITTMFEESVQPMRDAGYANFLFMNLPPLERTPGNVGRKGGPLPTKAMVDLWDATLARHAQKFKEENKGVTSLVYDANTFLNKVMDNPAQYGIKDVTGYCAAYNQPGNSTDYGCLPLDQYFWYNNGHM